MSGAPPAEPHCSFCNKSRRHVRKLIAGPKAFICDECVDICLDVLSEERIDAPAPAPPPEPAGHVGYSAREPYLLFAPCALCHMATPIEHLLAIHSRGALCPGCIGAVEAAIAASRDES